MKVTLTLTNHKTSAKEQIEKVHEEYKEVLESIDAGDIEHTVDELIDIAKTALKAGKKISENSGLDFTFLLEKNHNKNENRGYHD